MLKCANPAIKDWLIKTRPPSLLNSDGKNVSVQRLSGTRNFNWQFTRKRTISFGDTWGNVMLSMALHYTLCWLLTVQSNEAVQTSSTASYLKSSSIFLPVWLYSLLPSDLTLELLEILSAPSRLESEMMLFFVIKWA